MIVCVLIFFPFSPVSSLIVLQCLMLCNDVRDMVSKNDRADLFFNSMVQSCNPSSQKNLLESLASS